MEPATTVKGHMSINAIVSASVSFASGPKAEDKRAVIAGKNVASNTSCASTPVSEASNTGQLPWFSVLFIPASSLITVIG